MSKKPLFSFAMIIILCMAFNPMAWAATNQFGVTASSSLNYTINGVNDPTDIILVRGFTYIFNISVSVIHPFYIKTIPGTGTGNAYNNGVSAQGVTSGTVTFAVPNDAPDTLYYQCSSHFNMTGPLTIVDAPVVEITDFNIMTADVVIQSVGTDALNLNVETRSSLTNSWSAAAVLSTIYATGTNTTQVMKPVGNTAFFRVEQGFF